MRKSYMKEFVIENVDTTIDGAALGMATSGSGRRAALGAVDAWSDSHIGLDESDAIALDNSDSGQQVFYALLSRGEGEDATVPWLFVCVDCDSRLRISTCSPMTRAELRETIAEIYDGARIVADPLGIFPPGTDCVPLDGEDDCDDEDSGDESCDNGDFDHNEYRCDEVEEDDLGLGPLDDLSL